MGHHIIEFDKKCGSCKATGLYVGVAERDGAAVVCHTCKGTGSHHVKIEYDDFEGREMHSAPVIRVFEANPGIIITGCSAFGGMPYSDWITGSPFPFQSENRAYVCPSWWYQSVDYNKKPQWEECIWGGTFSSCDHFQDKQRCWERWDKEFHD